MFFTLLLTLLFSLSADAAICDRGSCTQATAGGGCNVSSGATCRMVSNNICRWVTNLNPAANIFVSGQEPIYADWSSYNLFNSSAECTCQFNGTTISDGGSVTAYQSPNVPFGSTCASETRTCTWSDLSGTYQYSSCTVDPPANCTFNGSPVAHGDSVTAYENSSVPFGSSCVSEVRSCYNGTLSGSFTNASCSTSAAADCDFNGTPVAHGSSVTAYQVESGSSCPSEVRTCDNGNLSGSYGFGSCTVTTPASVDCTFNGAPVTNGSSVTAYEVESGTSCPSENRTCTDGNLSGAFLYSSCTVTTSDCTFNGATVANGSSVTAYQVESGTSCPSENRTCSSGTLSGSYLYSSCTVSSSNCTFNGATVNDGSSVTAYQSSTVPFGGTCASEARTCTSGTLSGSYAYASCTVDAAANCTFNSSTVNHGASVTAYQDATVAFGGTCTSESRTCNNGTLSGSFTNASCTVATGGNCTFNGSTVLHGASVTAYQNASVPYGSTCTSETRTCTNTVLSGTFTNSSCTVSPAANCDFNGTVVNHGSSVTAYQVSSGTSCPSEARSCNNGTLSGSYAYSSCTVQTVYDTSNICNAADNDPCSSGYSSSCVDCCGCYPSGSGVQTSTAACESGLVKFYYRNYSECP